MKPLLTFLSFLISLTLTAQTFNFTEIPYSDPDIISPGRGAEQWHDGSDRIPNPTATQNINVENSLDVYHRFQWAQLQGVGADSNTYNWPFFDKFFIDAINQGQKLSFGVMTVYMDPPDNRTIVYDGEQIAFAPFLHDLMKNDATVLMRDWNNGSAWIPNPNSPHYLRHLRKLHQALYNRIMTQSYNGVPFRKVVYCIDIRGYGQYGEWHTGDGMSNFNSFPSTGFPNGMNPTVASLKEIIDTHTEVFDRWPLNIMVAAFNGSGGAPYINIFHQYDEIAHYAMDASNAWGPVGTRRDQVGAPDTYLHDLLDGNDTRFPAGVGQTIAQKFLSRYLTSPGTGEPMPFVATQPNGMTDVLNQMNLYHPTSFGNGNYIGRNNVNETVRTRLREAFRRSGYRIKLTGGNAVVASNFTINLNWHNIGVAPTYEYWQVQYILRNGSGTQVWTQNSSFTPKLFQPSGSPITRTDAYALPAIAAGSYGLYIKIVDTAGYRAPLPLAITGRLSDGSYFISNITFGTTPTNQLPVANAGPNQSITTTSANLVGSGSSDPDGSISGYLWTQVSGPNTASLSATTTANITASSLIAGTYVFNLRVTDNLGAVSNDQVSITVNLNTPPIANAGPNQSINLPTTSVTVSGSGSTDNVGVTSYAWSKVLGPASYVITSPTSSSTTITALEVGVYTFRLTVSDIGGLTGTDDVQITVVDLNTPPVANAGSNQSITLPTSQVTLNGNLSTDNVGIITYLWTKVGGPSTFTITSPSTVSTTVTGLVAGIYIFRLRVTDIAGLFNTDDIQVTVNTGNTTPVANAGPNQVITLPTSTVNVTGAGSSDDQGITGYLWTFVSGPAGSAIASPTSSATAINNLVQGVYQFRLRVTDAAGLTNTDEVQITVNTAANQSPEADAGENQSITLPTSSVTLDGSGSDDDVAVTSYLWTKVSGTGGTIASPTNVSTSITGLTAGTYVYRLRVTDVAGLFSTDDITIVVFAIANNSPVAVAGNPQTITLPTSSVSVSGSGSSDDNGIVSYSWVRVSGPGTSTIVSPTSSSTNITTLQEGTYTFRLTVTDGGGLTDTDDIVITVRAQGGRPSSDAFHAFWKWWLKFRARL